MGEHIETLVIQGPDGAYYALPWSVVAQHCVAGEDVPALTERLGQDVAGFDSSVEDAAAKQRALVGRQRQIRTTQHVFESLVRDPTTPFVGFAANALTTHWPP